MEQGKKKKKIESLLVCLRTASENIDQAYSVFVELEIENKKDHVRSLAKGSMAIRKIENHIFKIHPEFAPVVDIGEPDPELTEKQAGLVKLLSEKEIQEIDDFILSVVTSNFQKVAKIVGLTMIKSPFRIVGIPDIFYAQRVRKLVNDERLVSVGNLEYMRYSEVKLPD